MAPISPAAQTGANRSSSSASPSPSELDHRACHPVTGGCSSTPPLSKTTASITISGIVVRKTFLWVNVSALFAAFIGARVKNRGLGGQGEASSWTSVRLDGSNLTDGICAVKQTDELRAAQSLFDATRQRW